MYYIAIYYQLLLLHYYHYLAFKYTEIYNKFMLRLYDSKTIINSHIYYFYMK